MGGEKGDRRIRERGSAAAAYGDLGFRSRGTRALHEHAILVNVLIAALRLIIVMIFDVRRQCVVVMRDGIMLVRMYLGPWDARSDDHGREQYYKPTTGPGSATVHGLSVPQVGRAPSTESSGSWR